MEIQKIPITIQTAVVNVMMNISELNARQGGKKPCIMLVNDNADMTIVGCDCLSDIIFYSDYFRIFDKPINPEHMTVMRVLIADPTDLPFTPPLAASVFVLNDEFGISKFGYMHEATDYIEAAIATYTYMEIEDFAVLIGIELSDIIRARIINKIEEKRLERMKNKGE